MRLLGSITYVGHFASFHPLPLTANKHDGQYDRSEEVRFAQPKRVTVGSSSIAPEVFSDTGENTGDGTSIPAPLIAAV